MKFLLKSLIFFFLLAASFCLQGQEVFFQETSFSHSQLTGTLPATTITTPQQSLFPGSMFSNGQLVASNPSAPKNRRLLLTMDFGDVYPLGGHSYNYQLVITVNTKNASGVVISSIPCTLKVEDGGTIHQPESKMWIAIPTTAYSISFGAITESGTGVSDPLITNNLRIRIKGEQDVEYVVDHTSTELTNETATLILGSVSPHLVLQQVRYSAVRLSWAPKNGLLYFPSYDVEIVKVEPQVSAGGTGSLPLDWSSAARIELDNGENFVDVTLAEGDGYYVWRVRPVGNLTGGRSNTKNLGKWNSCVQTQGPDLLDLSVYGVSFPSGGVLFNPPCNLDLECATVPLNCIFYYEQFDRDLNWMYSRTFAEGGKYHESINYANGLNNPVQQQTKLISNRRIIGVQSVYDFSGRPTLQTLPAPTGTQYIGFKEDFFNNSVSDYSASDFDGNTTLYSPAVPDNGALSSYYSGNNYGSLKDFFIPESDSIPYSRTLYQPDATGRLWKKTSPGDPLKLTSGGERNTTYEYGSVAQMELDRIFGSEAPLDSTVIKLQTTDPNGVKSVEYHSKEGPILATCLNQDTEVPQMDGVGSELFTVTKTLAPGIFAPGGMVSESVTSFIASPNLDHDTDANSPKVQKLTLDYEITPASLSSCISKEDVPEICWECDYRVEIAITSVHFPQDPDRNIFMSFQINPASGFTCGSTPKIITWSDISTFSPTFTDPTGSPSASPFFAPLTSGGNFVYLSAGSYMISKKVYLDNVNPGTGNSFLDDHLAELATGAEGWTATENCCGDFTVDVSGWDCGELPALNCSSSQEIQTFAQSLYPFVTKELGSIPNCNNHSYYSYLQSHLHPVTNPSQGIRSRMYHTLTAFEVLIDSLICVEGLDVNDVNACFQYYGQMLEQNYEKASLICSGNAGNISPNDPAPSFYDEFDYLAMVLECLDYNPGAMKCSEKSRIVLAGTSEETTACTDASGDPTLKYFLVIPSGQTVDPCHNLSQAEVVYIPDPNNLPGTAEEHHNKFCYDSFLYPNTLTAGMSVEDAKAFLAQKFCECSAAYDPNPVSSGQQTITDMVDICQDRCESKRAGFEIAIDNYVQEFNINNGGIYNDQLDAAGNSIWDPSGSTSWRDLSEINSQIKGGGSQDKECLINTMVGQCYDQCELPLRQLVEQFNALGCVCGGPANCITWDNRDFECLSQLLDDPLFRTRLQEESEAYAQAFQQPVEFALVDYTAPKYSDFPAPPGQTYQEIIDFINKSLNFNMTYRTSQGLVGTATPLYTESFHNLTGLHFNQEVKNFVYSDQGSAWDINVVTNVVWKEPDQTFYWAEIREINVALYCGSTPGPLLSWAYSPSFSCHSLLASSSNATTGQIILNNPAGFTVQLDLVKFYFDNTGSFHAIHDPDACDYQVPGSIITSGPVNQTNYSAVATLQIPASGSGTSLFMEAGPLGDEHALFDSPIAWAGSQSATAQLITDEINNNFTVPRYQAVYTSPGLVSVYLHSGNFLNPVNPDQFEMFLSGSMASSVLSEPGTNVLFAFMTDSINNILTQGSCTALPTDMFESVCPVGFKKVSSGSASGATTIAQRLSVVEQKVDALLTEIIKFRAVEPNPLFTISGFPTSTYEYYEQTENVLVDGVTYQIYVSVAGESYYEEDREGESFNVKDIYAIRIGINCQSGGYNVADMTFENGTNTSGGKSPILPGLTINTGSSSGFNPFTFAGAIPYVITSITSNGGTPAIMNFALNAGNISPTASVTVNDFEIDFNGMTYIDPTISTGFLEGNVDQCPPAECEVCMRWVGPVTPVSLPGGKVVTCQDELQIFIDNQVDSYLEQCLNEKESALTQSYSQNCLGSVTDKFSISYDLNYGYYTLYYYDRAGNLIQTVPPEGVVVTNQFAAIQNFRSGNTTAPVNMEHQMITSYKYNSIGQLREQTLPDQSSSSSFWYNAAGQLVLSQNPNQKVAPLRYSYSRYDELGRVVETGEIHGFTPTFQGANNDIIAELWTDQSFPYSGGGYSGNITSLSEVTRTYYTVPSGVMYSGKAQRFLRNRVSYIESSDGYRTHYSYDPHGNVEWVIQEMPELGLKRVRYEYELISGNVKQVFYQEGTTEQLMHKYEYDEDNRIINVFTSRDGLFWDSDAKYDYYVHGPLARTNFGEDLVQASDNVYTIQGFLKSVNHPRLINDLDPGLDGLPVARVEIESGSTGSIITATAGAVNLFSPTLPIPWNFSGAAATATDLVHAINKYCNANTLPYRASNREGTSNEVLIYSTSGTTGAFNLTTSGDIVSTHQADFGFGYMTLEDEFGMELGYFHRDYERQGTELGWGSAHHPLDPGNLTGLSANNVNLFNGNISWWATNTRQGQVKSTDPIDMKVNYYRYDQLNRLSQSNLFKWQNATMNYTATSDYSESFEYDLNGNITTVSRYGNNLYGNGKIDQLVYNYPTVTLLSGQIVTSSNRLTSVTESVGTSLAPFGPHDIGDQPLNNYSYDAQGNIISDDSEDLSFEWNLQGKLAKVLKGNPVSTIISFSYDAMGNRTKKRITDGNNVFVESFHYVRDAQGNVMAVYHKYYDNILDSTFVELHEQAIYGSSRLGTYNSGVKVMRFGGNVGNIVNVTETPYGPELISQSIVKGELYNLWPSSNAGNNNSCLVDLNVSSATPVVNNYAPTGIGNVGRNVAVGEDEWGNTEIYYGVETFPGGASSSKLLARNLQNFTQISSPGSIPGEVNGKSIFARTSDNPNVYYLFTGSGGNIYWTRMEKGTANPSTWTVGNSYQLALFSPGGGSMFGLFTPITYSNVVKEYSFAVYNDFENGVNKVFIAVHQGSKIKIYQFDLVDGPGWSGPMNGLLIETISDNQVVSQPIDAKPFARPFKSRSSLDLGDLMISGDGSELAVNFYAQTKHQVRRFNINPVNGSATADLSKTLTLGTENRPNIAGNIRPFLKKAVISFDFIDGTNYIYYYQRRPSSSYFSFYSFFMFFNMNNDIKRIAPSTGIIEQVAALNKTNYTGSLRRGKNGKLYVIAPSLFNWFWSNSSKIYQYANVDDPVVGNITPGTISLNTGSPTGGISYQPFFKGSMNFYQHKNQREVGNKVYELADHLGNVRAVVSDRRMAMINSGNIVGYSTDVKAWNDYYAFGGQMPGRMDGSGGSYRYGFNGMEKDDEISGSGNSLDFGARIYDSRLGRWLSLDALASEMPAVSPYAYALNSPLMLIDVEGHFVLKVDEAAAKKYGLTELQVKKFNELLQDVESFIANNPDVVKFIAAQTGFSEQEVIEHSKAGQGPTIYLTENPLGANVSRTDAAAGQLPFDATFAQTYDEQEGSPKADQDAYKLGMISLILHEYTHYGDRKTNNGNITGQSDGDRDENGNPIPAKQKVKTSYFDHRGTDTDRKVTGTDQFSTSKDGGSGKWSISRRSVEIIKAKIKSGDAKKVPD